VRGETHNLFWAVQRLLQYGAGCRVLGGPELRAEMQRVVTEMARLYGINL
jgi:predicted DNA-binding transcriptional regulator YafY